MKRRTDLQHLGPRRSVSCSVLGLREHVFRALGCTHWMVSWHTHCDPPLLSFHKLEKRQPTTVEGPKDSESGVLISDPSWAATVSRGQVLSLPYLAAVFPPSPRGDPVGLFVMIQYREPNTNALCAESSWGPKTLSDL